MEVEIYSARDVVTPTSQRGAPTSITVDGDPFLKTEVTGTMAGGICHG